MSRGPNRQRRRRGQKEPISFGKAYAQSDTFRALFKEGMRLVEETADYLDGDGRPQRLRPPRPASIVYATEIMRLTTRLMQLASWLLLHRSVREGDMTAERGEQEKKQGQALDPATTATRDVDEALPERLRELIDRSLALQKRVERSTRVCSTTAEAGEANPVERQVRLLQAAFERDRA